MKKKPVQPAVRKQKSTAPKAPAPVVSFPTHTAPCGNPDCGDPICAADLLRQLSQPEEVDYFLGKGFDESQPEEVDYELGIVPTGKDATKKYDFEPAPETRPTTVNEIYDRYQTKLYLIDVSGSMGWGKLEIDSTTAMTPGVEEEKLAVQQVERKIDAVRGAMTNFAEARFKKFPDAQFGLMVFDDAAEMKVHPGAKRDEVIGGISQLSTDSSYAPGSGGTRIMNAVEHALAALGRRHQMGANQIILVTDGEDTAAGQIEDLLPRMKELNVVFDFILVQKEKPDHDEVVDALQRVCTATGGEYAQVSKSTDFQTKFLNASNRLALPPAKE